MSVPITKESAQKYYKKIISNITQKEEEHIKYPILKVILEEQILKEVTGIDYYFGDKDIKNGQLDWLIANKIQGGDRFGNFDKGSIEPDLIDCCKRIFNRRNTAIHQRELSPFRYKTLIYDMAEIIKFVSNVPIPQDIENYCNGINNEPKIKKVKAGQTNKDIKVKQPSVQEQNERKEPQDKNNSEVAFKPVKESGKLKKTKSRKNTLKSNPKTKTEQTDKTTSYLITETELEKASKLRDESKETERKNTRRSNHESETEQTDKSIYDARGKYILSINNIEIEPLSLEEIKQKIKKGELTRNYDIYRPENKNNKNKICTIRELEKAFEEFDGEREREYREKREKEHNERNVKIRNLIIQICIGGTLFLFFRERVILFSVFSLIFTIYCIYNLVKIYRKNKKKKRY